MLHNIFKHLGGIEHYGIVSLCLFCTVFTGVLVWAFMQRKPHLDRMARAPLDAEPADQERGHSCPHGRSAAHGGQECPRSDQPALGNTEPQLSNHE